MVTACEHLLHMEKLSVFLPKRPEMALLVGGFAASLSMMK